MKKLISTVLLLLSIIATSFGQEEITTLNFDASKADRIDLRLKYPELIRITTWDKKEVKIEANVLINDGRNNDDFKLSSELKGGTLEIESEIENLKDYRNYTTHRDTDNGSGMTVTRNGTTISRNGKWDKGIVVSVILEITIPKGMELNVDATYGIVEVLSSDIPLTIDARYGGVDVTVDEGLDLEIEASTQWGQIYHNLDTKLRAKGDGFPGKWMKTEASLNRGTQKLHVESQYGNVYLRKNK